MIWTNNIFKIAFLIMVGWYLNSRKLVSWSFVLISGILSGWATWTGAMQGRAAACDIRIGGDGWQYFLYIQVQYFKCSIDSIYYIQYWRLAAGKQYLSTSRPYHEWDGKIRAHLRRNLSPAFTSRRILNLTFREVVGGWVLISELDLGDRAGGAGCPLVRG